MAERARCSGTTGVVSGFDGAAGLGSIAGPDGTEFPFHCVEIEGGARTIDVGTLVEFDRRLKLGGVEAFSIRPAG